MTEAAERYRRAKSIFIAVSEIPTEQRSEYLDRACADDPGLRSEVEALLDDERTRGAALDRVDTGTQAQPPSLRGYRIERELGRGGMGVVWLAERDNGDFRQRVALKLLGHDALRDPERRARFRAERRILASLEHPNIARLLDGGSLADGTPYLAMEYVEGERLDVWADRTRPRLSVLLRLFVAICRAVQAAHQGLVVHRDLKPANILVDASGAPKLLDFGIAKLLDESIESEVPTGTGMQLLTPRYAAPEQVRGETITTATDVYSLGVVLYELLTGQSPYGRAVTAAPDQLRAICDTDPLRPSLVVRTDASGATSGAPPARLRGDLDAILLKCLRKAPQSRYRGAAELADDLEAFLDGRPVVARAGSRRYAFAKFVARHRVLVASTFAIIAVLAVATLLLRQQLEATRAQRDIAATERDRAEAVSKFIKDMFKEANPLNNDGRDPSMREGLKLGADRLARNTDLTPEVRGSLETTLAVVTRNVGDSDGALLLADRAVATLTPVAKTAPVAYAEALMHRGSLRQDKGRFDEAVADYKSSLQHVDGHDELLVADILSRLASLENDRDDLNATKVYLRESREKLLVLLGYPDIETAARLVTPGPAADMLSVVTVNECAANERDGKLQQALEFCELSLALKKRIYPGNEGRLETTLDVIGNIHARRGDHTLAAKYHREALSIAERVFGPEHVNVGASLLNLGLDLSQTGDLDGSQAMYERSIRILAKSQGAEHRYTLIARNNLANLYMSRGDFATALAEHLEILAVRKRSLGDDAPEVAQSLTNVAVCQQELGDSDGAISSMHAALDLLTRVRAPEHIDIQFARLDLAERLVDAGRIDEALPYAELAFPFFAGDGDNALARASVQFMRARHLIRDPATQRQAQALAREALAAAELHPNNDRVVAAEVRDWLNAHIQR